MYIFVVSLNPYAALGDRRQFSLAFLPLAKGKGKVHPCTGTEALYRPYVRPIGGVEV